MKYKEALEYIRENFNISPESDRLIQNILSYIESRFELYEDQQIALRDLLGGAIGISDEEVKNIRL